MATPDHVSGSGTCQGKNVEGEGNTTNSPGTMSTMSTMSTSSFQQHGDRGERDHSPAELQRIRDQNNSKMDGLLSKRAELPDDLACFLQQQKQRQARMETTMRSFPNSMENDLEKQEMVSKRKRNTHEDPLSHRIIEKRRRDRMNNCLADLSRLIPSSYLKKGRGRIEKTEIIEMAIKHMKHLQNHPCTQPEGCEMAQEIETGLSKTNSVESFRVGYHECLTESMHFLVEKEGLYSGNSFCVRLMAHLQKHYDRLGRASTSEIHSNVGRTWNGPNLPAENGKDMSQERNDMGVKSEYGVGSDESGYGSLKTDDDTVVNLTKNDSERRQQQKNRSYSPEPKPRDEPERFRHYSEQDDKPSDLSFHGESSENYTPSVPEESPGNQYKFKSNICQRFDNSQDLEPDYPQEKRRRRNSSHSEKDVDRSGPQDSRAYSPGPSAQSHSSYDSYSHHDRLMVAPSTRQQSFSSKQDIPKPLVHLPPESLDPHYSSPDIKQSSSPIPFTHPGRNLAVPKPFGQTLPIFALNAKGSYYIPLSIDSSVIAPFLNLFNDDYVGPLHPVTISVNFTGPLHQAPLARDQDRDREWRQPRGGVIQQPSVIKHWRDAP